MLLTITFNFVAGQAAPHPRWSTNQQFLFLGNTYLLWIEVGIMQPQKFLAVHCLQSIFENRLSKMKNPFHWFHVIGISIYLNWLGALRCHKVTWSPWLENDSDLNLVMHLSGGSGGGLCLEIHVGIFLRLILTRKKTQQGTWPNGNLH